MTRPIWQDEVVVAKFAKDRAARVPHAAVQISVLLHLVRSLDPPPGRILDVGTGDGVLLGALLEAFPVSAGIGVDFSPPMLARARERLRAFAGRASVCERDLASPTWRQDLSGPFDLVTSGFAIHHLTDARKRALYGEIHDLLAPGGLFVNLEHVASATARVESMWDDAIVDHQHAARRAGGEDVTRDHVQAEYRARPDRLANILAPVEGQLVWLRECGFVDVDCFWKYFELALFGGFRADA